MHAARRRRQGAAGGVAQGEEGQPPSGHLLGGPGAGRRRVEPQEEVEVVVRDGVGGAADGEGLDELAEAPLDPILAVAILAAAERGAAGAAVDPEPIVAKARERR